MSFEQTTPSILIVINELFDGGMLIAMVVITRHEQDSRIE